MRVAVILEHRGDKWNRMSFEALAAGQAVAGEEKVTALVIGNDLQALAADASKYKVEKVVTLSHPALSEYTPEGYTAALEQYLKQERLDVLVFPHTYQVRDYAPKLAARLRTALLSDVVAIVSGNGDEPVFVRQFFQGKLQGSVASAGGVSLISVQAGAFRSAEAWAEAAANVENVPVDIDEATIKSKPEAPFRETQRSVDLGAASMIVSVGRGIQEKDKLYVAEELAATLGAELAASRPICDNGWLPMERQVGSSGQTVAPKVYFALGISGAIQHLVGMKGSKTIVAVNKDETAPIFESADYGIVGDLFDIVPAITEELKKAKS